jgi:hypothetical protein
MTKGQPEFDLKMTIAIKPQTMQIAGTLLAITLKSNFIVNVEHISSANFYTILIIPGSYTRG